MSDQESNLPRKIEPVLIQDQMKEAYMDYAMSVIIGRALPDVRDGMKPVHRRILWAMHERGWRQNRPYVKSAKIVGEVIGNFHPHGDSAVYETMVRMVQDFVMQVPLVDGQGNYGSVDGDNAAAYRYTEARLTKMAEMLLRDIKKETVDFIPNFDDTRQEPVVLPAAFPNLLVNGSTGIAVGMATNIPPHNLNEVIRGCQALIENPELTVDDLMKYIPAPDFPTGGIILAGEGLRKAYRTGHGTIKIRARAEITESTRKKEAIIITELPYQVNKLTLITKIADLVREKIIEGVTDIRDESNREGIRVVIELKRDANAQIILNQLYKQTQLQVSYGINFLAISKNKPRQLNLKELLAEYIAHRREVIRRRTEFDLRKAQEKAHILEGLKIALDNIDEVIRIIRASKTVDIARHSLMETFRLSEAQATAILEMRLQRLTSMEVQKVIEELERLKKIISELEAILSSETRISGIAHDELEAVRTGRPIPRSFTLDDEEEEESEEKGKSKPKEPPPRLTEISMAADTSSAFEAKDLIADRNIVITLSSGNYIKSTLLDSFRRQKRGGKGVSSSSQEEEFPRFLLVGRRHQSLLFFTNSGRVFQLPCHELPETSRGARGKSIKNFLSLQEGEVINAMTLVNSFEENLVFVMVTARGILKKSKLADFSNINKRGIRALGLNKGDRLVDVKLARPDDDVFLAARSGNGLRTNLAAMRAMGRTAAGIIGMRLAPEDEIIGLAIVKEDSTLMVITNNGYGKRMSWDLFTARGRGGKGMTYLKVNDKSGDCNAVAAIRQKEDIIVITRSSMVIRLSAASMREMGRATTGVTLVRLTDGDQVAEIGIIPETTL